MIKKKSLILNYKVVILSVILCILCSGLVLGNNKKDANTTDDSNLGTINILVENNLLEYIEGFGLLEYYAGVKYIFKDGTECILDPATINWSSSDSNVAEIKENGTIFPKGEGKATIFAEYNGLYDSIELKVKKSTIKKLEVSAENITVNHKLHKKGLQNPYCLIATVTTASGKFYDVTDYGKLEWLSNDKDIAEVNNGWINTNKPGKAKITAKLFNGLSIDTQVNVVDKKFNKIKLSKNRISIDGKNGVEKVYLKAQFADGSEEDISSLATWESKNPNIVLATSGEIYAQDKGKTSLIVNFGDYSEVVDVIVNEEVNLESQKFPFP